jgi:nucleoside triphosphate diphosphatase
MTEAESLPQTRRLLILMRRLRDPVNGCPWDSRQDAKSLAAYVLEEAYEVVSAIEQGQDAALQDELGDLLFQVVFLSQLAAEKQQFDFEAVAAGITDKLTRRHPHVFSEASGNAGKHWEQIKQDERQARGIDSALGDVPVALPALSRAAKLGRRAAAVGFDWPDRAGVHAKIHEELAEVEAARRSGNQQEVEDEVGDLLLAVTSLARHLKVDPETALRRANAKFEQRFTRVEALARAQQVKVADLDAVTLDNLWREAKRDVQS